MSAPMADVALVVEGSYPYVTGGVASWVHQIITNLPEYTFTLVCLWPDRNTPKQDKYQVPKNVIHRQDLYLFEKGSELPAVEPNWETQSRIAAFHQSSGESRCPAFKGLEKTMRVGPPEDLLRAKASWRLLQELYQSRERDVSILDYFWTWRGVHAPLLHVMAAELPPARVYHPVSTGYAGFAAGVAKLRQDAGLLLTEHGLYTREREIEIANADWIYQEPGSGTSYAPHELFFKSWWRKMYQFLGQITYDLSDQIVTLHQANKTLQEAAGADPEKLIIVPNGIFPEAFAGARVERQWRERPFRVALVGRVVPIKDVKTFIRSVYTASQQVNLEAFVAGPTDEDPEYFAECEQLVDLLGLKQKLKFVGKVDLRKWLAEVDLNVLTSVSESQPLVILECSAAGIPTVATDVGACREMLEGQPGQDALLGPSGVVVPVASPGETANAIVALAKNPQRHENMVKAGLARVSRFYHQDAVFAFYREAYARLAKAAGRS